MIYGIIGTGAIGGYYGGRLAKAGNEVHFLLHSDYEYVLQNGLQIDSHEESFHLDKPHVYNSTDDMPKCDVVIVALKTTNNKILREILPPLLKENTIVLLIQNGIGVEADLQEAFPSLGLAAGLAFICASKTKPGCISHQFYGSINVANYSCKDVAQYQCLLTELREAGIKTYDMEYVEARWRKAVWNMPFNGMTVVMNTRTDQLLLNPSTRDLIKDLMMEVIGAAQASGVTTLDESFADKMIESTIQMVPYSPSMKLDFDFKRQMEIYYLYTRPIEEAVKVGFNMPKLRMLEQQLLFIQRQIDKK